MDSTAILTAPGLRCANSELAADAWNAYRRSLIVWIRKALVVGFSWKELLNRLGITLSDASEGYSRLENYITNALTDTVLLEYPLLHADVLIYTLDESYGSSSQKYHHASEKVEWEQATSRRIGEDAISLARRITAAYLKKLNEPAVTNLTVWTNPTHRAEINNRMAECLLNDENSTARGEDLSERFKLKWEESAERESLNPGRPIHLTLSAESLARLHVIPRENSRWADLDDELEAEEPPAGSPGQPRLPLTHRTGSGAKERRAEARAHLQRS